MSITLKDKDNADVVFSLKNRVGNTAIFAAPGTSLLDRKQLTLQLVEKGNTNRIIAKLSVPTLIDSATDAEVPKVAYTEVGSLDLSAVLVAAPAEAQNFVAMFASLTSSAAISSMYLSGTVPN